MRAKGINQMSTRRAVRPDAMVYRQTRRLTRRKRSFWPIILIAAIVLLAIIILIWRWRHH